MGDERNVEGSILYVQYPHKGFILFRKGIGPKVPYFKANVHNFCGGHHYFAYCVCNIFLFGSLNSIPGYGKSNLRTYNIPSTYRYFWSKEHSRSKPLGQSLLADLPIPEFTFRLQAIFGVEENRYISGIPPHPLFGNK